MKKIKKFTMVTFVLMMMFTVSLTSYAETIKDDNGGWIPVFDKTNALTDVRVIVSPLHYEYASPRVGKKNHINLIIMTKSGVRLNNFHIYKRGKCVEAWDSQSRLYVENIKDKCYDDPNEAVIELLRQEEQYSMQQQFKDSLKPVVGVAIASIVVYWLVKILISFFSGSPIPLFL